MRIQQIVQQFSRQFKNSVDSLRNKYKIKRINQFLILNFSCYQSSSMLSRHSKSFQVKCNFCLEWMSIATQLKFNIHVCDNCLHKGCEEKSLQTRSSSGEIYQLHIINQKYEHIVEKCQKYIQTTTQEENALEKDTISEPQKDLTEVPLDYLNQAKESQIQEIKTKWNIIQSFINQKDFLSTQEIGFLKILLSQNPQNLSLGQPSKHQYLHLNSKQTSEFLDQQNGLKISALKQNNVCESVSNFNPIQINIKIADKQKQQIPLKKATKLKQNITQGKQNFNLKSPCKVALGQRDLNRNYGTHCKLPQLKQNFLSSTKRINTSFFDESPSPISSRTIIPTFVAQPSSRSAFGSSFTNSITKRLNCEQIKRFEQTKNKILKYLQKTYDSQPLARLMISVVFEANKKTSVIGKSIELVSYNLSYTDFRCYLESLDWTGIEVLKLVNTRLEDDQLKTLVDFIITKHLPINVLVLTGNRLTETSIQLLAEQDLPSVKQIYLGKNHITRGKVRAQTFALQNKYSLYM